MALMHIPKLNCIRDPFTFKMYASKKRENPISVGPFALPPMLCGHVCIITIVFKFASKANHFGLCHTA